MATPGDARSRPASRQALIAIGAGSLLALTLVWLVVLGRTPQNLYNLPGDGESLSEGLLGWFKTLIVQARFWIGEGYKAHPVAVISVMAGAAVPLLAIGVSGARLVAYRAKLKAVRAAASQPLENARPFGEAWLLIEGGASRSGVRLGELCRIGASEDCDIGAGEAGVAAFHALIQRRMRQTSWSWTSVALRARGCASMVGHVRNINSRTAM
ncbi:MAG: hypothetical protein R3D67_09770 [Hyphomicrobiaceae bacterium]